MHNKGESYLTLKIYNWQGAEYFKGISQFRLLWTVALFCFSPFSRLLLGAVTSVYMCVWRFDLFTVWETNPTQDSVKVWGWHFLLRKADTQASRLIKPAPSRWGQWLCSVFAFPPSNRHTLTSQTVSRWTEIRKHHGSGGGGQTGTGGVWQHLCVIFFFFPAPADRSWCSCVLENEPWSTSGMFSLRAKTTFCRRAEGFSHTVLQQHMC